MKGAIATITPVRPPITKVAKPPTTYSIGTVRVIAPASRVAKKHTNCTAVGMATADDAAEKSASVMPGNPVVNMWCTHSPKLRNPVPMAASTTQL